MIRRICAHPVAAFILLAFAFSYLLGLPFQVAVQAWLPRAPELFRFYLGRTLVVYGPALAALVVTAATGGGAGLRRLLARYAIAPRDSIWLLALPLLGLAVAAAGYALAGVPPGALGQRLAQAWPLLTLHLALQWIIIGIGEETGWRGWLLPALLRSHNRLVASALLATAWGLWHMPLLLSGVRTAALFLAGVGALTLLFTALWARVGGSVALLALAHAAFNAPLVFFEAAFGPALARSALERSQLVLLAAALLLVLARRRWWAANEPGYHKEAARPAQCPPLPLPQPVVGDDL